MVERTFASRVISRGRKVVGEKTPPSPGNRPRDVLIANQHPHLRLNRRAVMRVIHVLDACFAKAANSSVPRNSSFLSCPPGELSLVFLTDKALAELHGDFLDDPTTTDVITFEGHQAANVAGEVCVSVDTAAAYAKEHRRDFAEELTLYLVHGWLHLAGYDDLRPALKRVMRRAENRALQLLRANNAMPEFSLRPGSSQRRT
jgi:probable rRNA maturation factor